MSRRLTGTEAVRVLAWAARSQRMAVAARDRGDYIASREHLDTAARYRRMVYGR